MRNDDRQGASEEKAPSEAHVLSSEGSCREDIFFYALALAIKYSLCEKYLFDLFALQLCFSPTFLKGLS